MWTIIEHSLLESYTFVYIILIYILINSSGVNTVIIRLYVLIDLIHV